MPEAKVFDFSRLTLNDISPGVMIEGFDNISGINYFVEFGRKFVLENYFPQELKEQERRHKLHVRSPASDTLRSLVSHRYTGRLQSLIVVILPQDTSFITTDREHIEPDTALNFLAILEAHQSLMNTTKPLEKEFVLYIRRCLVRPQNRRVPHIMLQSRTPAFEIRQLLLGTATTRELAEKTQRWLLEQSRSSLA